MSGGQGAGRLCRQNQLVLWCLSVEKRKQGILQAQCPQRGLRQDPRSSQPLVVGKAPLATEMQLE